MKIKILTWNINGVRTHEKELYHLILKTKPDMIVLNETRAPVDSTFAKISPGAIIEQIPPVTGCGAPNRAGTAVIAKPGSVVCLEKRLSVMSPNKRELVQAIRVGIGPGQSLVGMYAGPLTSARTLDKSLKEIHLSGEHRTIVTGDINARHKIWDTTTNGRGKTLVNCVKRWNYKVTSPEEPSYIARGRVGSSKPDILLDIEAANVSQPKSPNWCGSSDHTPVLFTVNEANLKTSKRRVSKTMSNNTRNRLEASTKYQSCLPPLIERIKKADASNAQEIYAEISRTITDPWIAMVKRRPLAKKPHWNLGQGSGKTGTKQGEEHASHNYPSTGRCIMTKGDCSGKQIEN